MPPHYRLALTFVVLAPLMVFPVAGCSRAVHEVLLEGDRSSMLHDDAEAERRRGRDIHPSLWFSGKELDAIARRYAREQRIDFRFSGVDTQIWVPRSRDYLADVEYSSGIGKPVLSVTINWDGTVREHRTAIAIDRHEMSPRAGEPPDTR